jgi:hypothetical protein
MTSASTSSRVRPWDEEEALIGMKLGRRD